jgi:hypothetical protein
VCVTVALTCLRLEEPEHCLLSSTSLLSLLLLYFSTAPLPILYYCFCTTILLCEQLGFDLKTESQIKIQWLRDAVASLDQRVCEREKERESIFVHAHVCACGVFLIGHVHLHAVCVRECVCACVRACACVCV